MKKINKMTAFNTLQEQEDLQDTQMFSELQFEQSITSLFISDILG